MASVTTPFPATITEDGSTWCCGMAGCSKTIPTSKKSLIVYHKNTHFPKYKCDFCLQLFPQKNRLDVHVRTVHTGEKPYECSHCEKCFPQLSNLQDHVRKHHCSSNERKDPGAERTGVLSSHVPYVSADKAWVDVMVEIDILLSRDMGGCKLDHGARRCGAEPIHAASA